MVEYSSSEIYVTSASDISVRLTRIRQVIDNLILLAISTSGSGKSKYDSYELDDGQVKIFAKYRSTKDINEAIQGFEALEQRYLNQLNGRKMRMIDSKNFRQKC